jgi:ATP-dependent helicase HrpA
VVVVAGETGSGKTTQLPKICLELGRGRAGASVTRSRAPCGAHGRTAYRRGTGAAAWATGGLPGALSRAGWRGDGRQADDRRHPAQRDARDRDLRQYDTLIIDEAHERSLNIDFLLGYLKQLLARRDDLKLIITSATIDEERFARHFFDAPVIRCPGAATRWRRTTCCASERGRGRGAAALVEEAVSPVRATRRLGPEPGDMLVFLPGERDIRDVAQAPAPGSRPSTCCRSMPASARRNRRGCSAAAARRGLRVVLATNVAETSVTVPGIRYVIDPGVARISRYSYRTRVQRLPIEPISRASANQRMGTLRPRRSRRLPAPVQRSGLSRPTRVHGAGDPAQQPRCRGAADAAARARRGRALPVHRAAGPAPGARRLSPARGTRGGGWAQRLTRLGRRMAAFPVDPTLSRMLLAARSVLVSCRSCWSSSAPCDPGSAGAAGGEAATGDQSHARFRHSRSDFLSLLNLWRYYEAQRQT